MAQGLPSGRPARSLKARALQWLAQREHSRAELQRKLLRYASEAAEDIADSDHAAPLAAQVEILLDWLEAHRYLSDERFVESRIHARSQRFGNQRIRHELAQHGLQAGPAAAQALSDSELERARAVWSRKFTGPGVTPAERARQARFLAGRGFSAEVIRALLRNLPTADDKPD
jgi:regulatory protein